MLLEMGKYEHESTAGMKTVTKWLLGLSQFHLETLQWVGRRGATKQGNPLGPLCPGGNWGGGQPSMFGVEDK